MKIYIYLIIAVFTCLACESDDSEVTTSPPLASAKISLSFKNYVVNNVNLFKGPSGNSINVTESYIQNYWTLYKEPSWKKVEINLEEMSLTLITENSADLKYNISLKQDSVFIKENNNLEYLGDFDKNISSLKVKRVFKYLKKVPLDNSQALFISKITGFGIANYSNVFPSDTFTSPSNMTQTGDEVFWANVTYNYSLN